MIHPFHFFFLDLKKPKEKYYEDDSPHGVLSESFYYFMHSVFSTLSSRLSSSLILFDVMTDAIEISIIAIHNADGSHFFIFYDLLIGSSMSMFM